MSAYDNYPYRAEETLETRVRDFTKNAEILIRRGLVPQVKYPGPRQGWKCRCLECGKVVWPHYSTIQQLDKYSKPGGCRECGKRRSEETRRRSFLKVLPERLKPFDLELVGPYVNAKQPSEFKCLICKRELKGTYDSFTGSNRTQRKCPCKRLPRRPLATFAPDLAEELVDELNNGLTKHTIGTGRTSNVWWRCRERGHLFDASPANRCAKNGSGCRYCQGLEAYRGENDLATLHPELCKELSVRQEVGFEPKSLLEGSSQKVLWVCRENPKHVYPMSPYERIKLNSGCSFCAGKRVLPGDNDLATLRPELALEWDLEANFPWTPNQFTEHSNKEFFWICTLNQAHKWPAKITTRSKGHGCPICARVMRGRNDLETRVRGETSKSHLLTEWSETNSKVPSEVAFSSNDNYKWTCTRGHLDYEASPANRWFCRTGCPTCAPGAYSVTKPGKLYFISKVEIGAMKIGITNVGAKTDRVGRFVSKGWDLIHEVQHDSGLIARTIEKRMFAHIREELVLPQLLAKGDLSPLSGETETFKYDEKLLYLRELIDFHFQAVTQSLNFDPTPT